jgi:hypothetical protein
MAISFCYKEYVGISEEITVSGDRELPKCSQSEEWQRVELAYTLSARFFVDDSFVKCLLLIFVVCCLEI